MCKYRLFLILALVMALLLFPSCQFSQPNDDVYVIEKFGYGRIQIQEDRRHAIKGQHETYGYEAKEHTCTDYWCYKLYDTKEEKSIQYTLYDYQKKGKWIYSYGNSGYIKLNIKTMETFVYSDFDNVPDIDQQFFEGMADAFPVRHVTITDEKETHIYCEVDINKKVYENGVVIDELTNRLPMDDYSVSEPGGVIW